MRILKYFIFFIALLALGFFSLGVINPTVNYTHEIVIEKPVEAVWEVFVDSANMDQWVPNFKSIELISGKQNTKGSRYKLVVVDDEKEYEIIETITEFRPNDQFTIQLENEMLTNQVESIFTEINGRTRIATTNRIEGKGLMMKSSLMLMKSHFIEQSEESYNRLKSLVESY